MAQSKGDRRFPRTSHLRRTAQFERNRRTGRRLDTKHFAVCISPGPEPECRLGLVVSKKVGTAVQRNRVKRVVREVFRNSRRGWPEGLDVVVIARPGSASMDYDQVAGEILTCVERFVAGRGR